jgi:hypothetical protein
MLAFSEKPGLELAVSIAVISRPRESNFVSSSRITSSVENQLNLPANGGFDPYDFLVSQVRNSALSSGDVENSINQLERVRRSNEALQQSLVRDVQTLEAINNQINQINSRVLPIVESASRKRLGAEPEKWKS